MRLRLHYSVAPAADGLRPEDEAKAVLICSLSHLVHLAEWSKKDVRTEDVTTWMGLMDHSGKLMIADAQEPAPRVGQVFKDKRGLQRQVCAVYWDVCTPLRSPPFWVFEVTWFRPDGKSRYGQRSGGYSWADWAAGAEEVKP